MFDSLTRSTRLLITLPIEAIFTMENLSVQLSDKKPEILDIEANEKALIESHGLEIRCTHPLGVEVCGADVRSKLPESVIKTLSIITAKARVRGVQTPDRVNT